MERGFRRFLDTPPQPRRKSTVKTLLPRDSGAPGVLLSDQIRPKKRLYFGPLFSWLREGRLYDIGALMDTLDRLISEKETQCVALEAECREAAHRLEVSRIELRTLKLAALVVAKDIRRHMDGNGRPIDPGAPTGKGPRALWEISGRYRNLVDAILAKGNPLMDSSEISALAKTVGLDLTPRHAGGRFRKYSHSRMAERIGNRYRLSEDAARFFEQSARAAADGKGSDGGPTLLSTPATPQRAA